MILLSPIIITDDRLGTLADSQNRRNIRVATLEIIPIAAWAMSPQKSTGFVHNKILATVGQLHGKGGKANCSNIKNKAPV